ncbi:hypothetical protein PLICRDRAFT_171110 [Plicaturopsis crispa FD-325 SS-3]|nr:hypothetical protein PLICRDRAFT_171110 [Plicaturopsis crispa FD-325 SS-3]
MADNLDPQMQAFIQQESAKAHANESIQNYTEMCWDKCVTGAPSTRFSRSEESCLANCVDRFLDTSLFIVKQVQSKREQGP